MQRYGDALAVIAAAMAQAVLPPSRSNPAEWAAKNLFEVVGPRAGRTWDPDETPQIAAIIRLLAPGQPYTELIVRKSAQIGFTRGMEAWLGFIIAEDPAPALMVMPTIQMVADFNKDKLQATIEASPALRSRVRGASRRDMLGSSALSKRFPGGSITLTGANSSAALRSRTVKYTLRDEVDDWPDDLDGQGDPMSMVDARQISYHATRQHKSLIGSTPTNIGGGGKTRNSRIEALFQAGTREFWTFPCLSCGADMRFEWRNIRFEPQKPHRAYHVSPCCGGVTEHWQKRQCIAAGRFVAERSEPGLSRSFHVDALSSNLTTWDKAVEVFLDAGDDPQKQKGFFNLWLGLPYEEAGDAPDWQPLYKRREDYAQLVVPDEALYVTSFADVQKRGVWIETVGWGADRRSWSLDARFFAGNPEDPEDQVWRELAAYRIRPLKQANGIDCDIDVMGIDAGYLTGHVYDFVRKQPNVLACKGVPGWDSTPLHAPVTVDFDWRGKRVRRGAQLWKIATWNLKSQFYAYLRRELAIVDGHVLPPEGYCHFGTFLDEEYFRQITAEYLGINPKTRKREWRQREQDNHLLDCRIGNMALAFGYLQLRHRTPQEFALRAASRGVRNPLEAPLLALESSEKPENRPEKAPETPPRPRTPWVERRDDWISR